MGFDVADACHGLSGIHSDVVNSFYIWCNIRLDALNYQFII
jgi:hypothetical protein